MPVLKLGNFFFSVFLVFVQLVGKPGFHSSGEFRLLLFDAAADRLFHLFVFLSKDRLMDLPHFDRLQAVFFTEVIQFFLPLFVFGCKFLAGGCMGLPFSLQGFLGLLDSPLRTLADDFHLGQNTLLIIYTDLL